MNCLIELILMVSVIQEAYRKKGVDGEFAQSCIYHDQYTSCLIQGNM